VKLVVDLLMPGVQDPVIAAIGDRMSALVVTWDKDFEQLVKRVPDGNRTRFRNLGRISFKCKEPRGVALLERWMETIEFHFAQCAKHGDGRLIIQVQESGLKLM
jgi:hypothetical protein